MEAKDTVITRETVMRLGLSDVRLLDPKELKLLEAQAEISFKAGIREVVGWMNKRDCSYHYLGEKVHAFKVVEEEWQAKLKEWGME